MKSYFWDIETSTITTDEGVKMQITYLSNVVDFNLINGQYTSKFFRTIEETREYFKILEEGIVFVHNLNYELTFLLRDMEDVTFVKRRNKYGETYKGVYNEEVDDIIFRDKNSPLSIKLTEFSQLTFRDSLAIFNKSVAQLGQDLIKRGVNLPKLDYDYKKVRTPWDKLTQLDYDYNERDNLIVATSLFCYMRDNKISGITNIPLTFTSAIKNQRKEFILENYGKKNLLSYHYEQDKQIKDYEFFNLATRVYQGGLTTSAISETNKFIEKDIYSIDIKSSYPYQMCTRRFPCFYEDLTIHLKGKDANDFFNTGRAKFYLGVFNFINLRVKNEKYLLPISTSQMQVYANNVKEQNIKLFNGKVMSADNLILPCNNLDIQALKLIYDFDLLICEEIFYTTKERLLKESEVSFLLHLFNIKENTPKDEKDSTDYLQAKQGINGQYGIKVTSPIRSTYYLDDEELKEIDYYKFLDSDEYKEQIYNNYIESQNLWNNKIDIYTDGVYITSYARLQLISQVKELVDMGCNVVYSDTDSIKFYCNDIEHILGVIENDNNLTVKKNKTHYRFKQYKERFSVSDKEYDKICKLGIWEVENLENPYKLFVTYGAKKYAYLDNEGIHITIAGCNKYDPVKAMNEFSKKNNISLYDVFKIVIAPNTRFDIGVSGRKTMIREDRQKEIFNNLKYKGKLIRQYGGIILEDTTYTLNMTYNDSLLLGHLYNTDVVLTLKEGGEIE